MINLLDFLVTMVDYSIIRIDTNFPNFNVGEDDIDILCLNMEQTCNHIINILETKYNNLHYRKFSIDNKVHIDIIFNSKFIIKFDLCDNIQKLYPKFNIPFELTTIVIKKSTLNNYKCKVPVIEHELMLRQLEYDTYIKTRPDKIKHLQFIEKYNIEYLKFNEK
tara:strand:+ start:1795 stop:2286 length:492 start_codon:yes stop_codon:yes gene_type:complete